MKKLRRISFSDPTTKLNSQFSFIPSLSFPPFKWSLDLAMYLHKLNLPPSSGYSLLFDVKTIIQLGGDKAF